MKHITPAFKNRVVNIHGQAGQDWLSGLPGLQRELILRWSLNDLHPVPDLSYNYLVFCSTARHKPAVLKLGVPHRELESEIASLKVFDGDGAVQMIASDPDQGALLLERVIPGDDLRTIRDDQKATRIAARVMKNLWKPDPDLEVFPTAEGWCQGFQRYLDQYPGNGPLPREKILNARNIADELLKSPQGSMLLHGDLHHRNILRSDDGSWIAIDPKGVIGEPAFEVGALLLNPVPDLIHQPGLRNIQDRRLAILSEELNIDRKRLTRWSYVRAVLASVWSLDDGESSDYGIMVSEVLKDI